MINKIQIGLFIKTIQLMVGYFISLVILRIHNRRNFISILRIIQLGKQFKKTFINMSQVILRCIYNRYLHLGEDFRDILKIGCLIWVLDHLFVNIVFRSILNLI